MTGFARSPALRPFGGDKDAEAVLERLDRLTQHEARLTTAEILKAVYGLVQGMSKQTHFNRLLLGVVVPLRPQGN